jgi:hypothetical protein
MRQHQEVSAEVFISFRYEIYVIQSAHRNHYHFLKSIYVNFAVSSFKAIATVTISRRKFIEAKNGRNAELSIPESHSSANITTSQYHYEHKISRKP